MEAFELGAGVHLLRNTGTPVHLVRSARHVRQGTREEMAFYVQSRGEALLTTGGDLFSLRRGQLGAVDVTRPYALRQLTTCDSSVLLIEFGRLGLPVDVTRAAIRSLSSSPLYRLIREHLLRLAVDLPVDAAALTGQATADLLAALVATVSDHPAAREVLNMTEPARVAAYIDERLDDPDLTTGQIAAAHGMSARQLTVAWRRAHDATPADWIIRRRLERATQLLLDPALTPANMDDIAYACGFRDVADLGQRFRAAYGISPRDVITVAGTEDNVKALVYLSGYALAEGESLAELQGRFPDSLLASGLVYRNYPVEGSADPGTDVSVDPAKFREIFAADVEEDLARVLAVSQRPLAAVAFSEKAAAAAWLTKPAWGVVSTADHTINPDVERFGYSRAGITPVEIDSSHLVMLAHPKEAFAVIRQALDSVQGTAPG
jgi:AraC-like DNA-binding protein